jgi:hypothetical protein
VPRRPAGARFGSSVATARIAGEGVVVIGAPFDDVSSKADAGSAFLYGTGATGLFGFFGPVSAKAYSQNTANIPGNAEPDDRFAAAVSLLDVDSDGSIDLVAGAPYEGLGSATRAGAVYVIRDAATSPSAKVFTQDTSGIVGTAESSDRFGTSLS